MKKIWFYKISMIVVNQDKEQQHLSIFFKIGLGVEKTSNFWKSCENWKSFLYRDFPRGKVLIIFFVKNPFSTRDIFSNPLKIFSFENDLSFEQWKNELKTKDIFASLLSIDRSKLRPRARRMVKILIHWIQWIRTCEKSFQERSI